MYPDRKIGMRQRIAYALSAAGALLEAASPNASAQSESCSPFDQVYRLCPGMDPFVTTDSQNLGGVDWIIRESPAGLPSAIARGEVLGNLTHGPIDRVKLHIIPFINYTENPLVTSSSSIELEGDAVAHSVSTIALNGEVFAGEFRGIKLPAPFISIFAQAGPRRVWLDFTGKMIDNSLELYTSVYDADSSRQNFMSIVSEEMRYVSQLYSRGVAAMVKGLSMQHAPMALLNDQEVIQAGAGQVDPALLLSNPLLKSIRP